MSQELERAKAEVRENRQKAPLFSLWRHKKSGGHYIVRRHAIMEADLTPVVLYGSVNSDIEETWCRPASEFFDGRFELLLKRDDPCEKV